jgi:4-amino-4-deoxy-L-arabinose transferase-like glycosyltransferase
VSVAAIEAPHAADSAREIRRGWWIAAAAAIAALALNFHRLDQPNLWIDEIYTARWTQMSVADLFRSLATDLHPPLYFLIERLIVHATGLSERGLRGFSAATGAACVLAAYWAFRPALGSRAARATACVLALMPDFGLYARMARYYAPATLLALIAHGLFVRVVARSPRPRAWRVWSLYAAVVAAIAYTSYAAMCVPLAHGAVLAWRRDRGALKGWALAMAAAAIVFLPWARVFVHQLHTARTLPPSVIPGGLRALMMPAYELFALTASELLTPWTAWGICGAIAGAATIVLGARAARSRCVQWAVTGTALAACGVGILLLAVLTRATPFVAAPARLLFLWPFAAALIGLAFSGQSGATRVQHARSDRAASLPRAALMLAIGVVWCVAWSNLYAARAFLNPIYLTPAREAARELAANARPDDLLLIEDDTGVPWYLARLGFHGRIVDPIDSLAAARALAQGAQSGTQSAPRAAWIRLARDGSARMRPAAGTRAMLATWGRKASEQGYLEFDPALRSVKARLLGTEVERYRLYVEWHDRGP